MEDLREFRYPWNSAIEFWAGGFWLELEASHLLMGWLFIAWSVLRINYSTKSTAYFNLATLYFAFTVYTNPAYNILSLNINEIFGISSILIAIQRGGFINLERTSPASKGLILVCIISLIHNLISFLGHPNLVSDWPTAATKTAVNLKILVLALNMLIIGRSITNASGLKKIIKTCIAAGTFALLMYLLQIAITLTGTLPYGTFLDAGFIGVPSFGSVSVERGHMGKFIAPYFSFFLFALIQWKWRWRFALFLSVSAINFSASGQVFLTFSIFIAFCIFRKSLTSKSLILIAISWMFAGALIFEYWPLFEAIIEKINTIALQGDESQAGGRSMELFWRYIENYPFGIGYGGSSLRTAPNLPEINAAHLAFISQYSFLAIPIVIGYLYLILGVSRLGLRGATLGRCMAVGAIMSPIIFFVDILWFVPMVWLPIEIMFTLKQNFSPPLGGLVKNPQTTRPPQGNLNS